MNSKMLSGQGLVQRSAFASATVDMLADFPGLTPEGKSLVELLAADKRPEAPTCRHRVRGELASTKMRHPFPFDDYRLDYRHAIALEASRDVLAYWKWQPCGAEIFGDEPLAGTTIVVLTPGGGEIHELLEDREIRRRLRDFDYRYYRTGAHIGDRAADDVAAKLGMRHRIIASSGLNATRTKNMLALLRLEPQALDLELQASVRTRVELSPGITLGEIMRENRQLTLHAFMQMLAEHQLSVDLSAFPLSAEDAWRFPVYRDEQQLEIARQATLARSAIPPTSAQIVLQSGTRVALLEGVYTVMGIEGENVLLESDAGRQRAMNRFALTSMVREGKARAAVPTAVIAKHGMAQLLHASAAELAHATKLHDLVAHLMRYLDRPGAARREGVVIGRREARILRRIRNAGPGAHPVAALLPDYSGRGRDRLPAAVIEMTNAILQEAFSRAPGGRKTRAFYWHLLLDRCEKQNLKGPSEETFRVRWNAHSRRYGARQLYSEVKQDAHGRSMPNLLEERLQSARCYGELACVDSTELPLRIYDWLTGEELQRVYLTILLDVYSRCILAFHLDFRPPCAETALALLHTCVERHGFLPQNIFSDNGPDLRSEQFVSALRNNKVDMFKRPPFQAKFCGMVESMLGHIQSAFFKNLQGTVKPPQKNSLRQEKTPDGCWDIWSLQQATEGLLYEKMPALFHTGIGMTPADRREQGFPFRAVVPIDSRDGFSLFSSLKIEAKNGEATIVPGRGVKVRGLDYFAGDFNHIGTGKISVPVFLAPCDLSFVWVYSPVTGKPTIAVSSLYERMQSMDGVERRLFISEFLERKRAQGNHSAEKFFRSVAVQIEEMEEYLNARLAHLRPARAVPATIGSSLKPNGECASTENLQEAELA